MTDPQQAILDDAARCRPARAPPDLQQDLHEPVEVQIGVNGSARHDDPPAGNLLRLSAPWPELLWGLESWHPVQLA
ncbi:MAG: hypothetical protein JWM40_1332 [Frankiales bacterium]|nr:hypothetical protein [Frankiales bacterium]